MCVCYSVLQLLPQFSPDCEECNGLPVELPVKAGLAILQVSCYKFIRLVVAEPTGGAPTCCKKQITLFSHNVTDDNYLLFFNKTLSRCYM